MEKILDKKDLKNILILFPISIFAFFSNIWVRPADLMEARNFITAKEMIENDNFIVPTLNGFLRFEKPPLPTWFTAFVMKITGNFTDEWVLRIPAALTGIIFIFLLYYFVKILTKNSRKSFITAFVGTTTFMLIKIGNENAWDIYPYVFAFGCITFLVKGFLTEKIKDFFIGGIFLAASFMSKGPVGIYGLIIPFFISYGFVFGVKKYKKNFKKIIFMILTGIILGNIWSITVYTKYPEIFLSVMKKEESTWTNRHTESFIYYMDYFVYMGIWIFFSFMALIKNWSRERTGDKNYSKFIFLWNILIILFLSFIKMKKKRYGLPIYMTSIMEVGAICSYYYNKFWYELKKSDKILLYVQGIFMSIVSFAVPFIIFLKGYMYKEVGALYILMLLVIFIPFGYISAKSLINKKSWTIKFIILGSGVLMLFANATANWFFDRTFIKKTNNMIEYQKIKLVRENPPKYEIYAENFEIEDVWRVGKKIKNFEKEKRLPKEFIFFGEMPEEISKDYETFKKEIYVKDDGHLAELNYLKRRGEV